MAERNSNMETLTVKKIDPRLWQHKLAQVLKAAYRVEAELLGVQSFPPLMRASEDLVQCGNEFFCLQEQESVQEQGGLLGAMELEYPADVEAPVTLASLAVMPEHFSRGIGSLLVQCALREYAVRGITCGELLLTLAQFHTKHKSKRHESADKFIAQCATCEGAHYKKHRFDGAPESVLA